MTGIAPQSPIVSSNPIAELAANMAAFKVDTEVRCEEAAEAREEAFKGSDTQEKNTAVELLNENKALADLYAQAQKELAELKAQFRKTDIGNKHEITVLKSQLNEERAEKIKLRSGADGVIKVLEKKHYTAPPIEPKLGDYRDFSPQTAKYYLSFAIEDYKWLGELYKAVNHLEDAFN